MRPSFLLDTGPLVALLRPQDRFHGWIREQLGMIEPPLLTCEAVLSEACFLLRRERNGPEAVLALVEEGFVAVSFPLQDEASSIKKLLTRYVDIPISFADACLIRMAERVSGSTLLTIDSDFTIYRMHGRQVIPIVIPDEVLKAR